MAVRAREQWVIARETAAVLRRAERAVPRQELFSRVWDPVWVGTGKTLDVHIKRIRSKIEDDPSRAVHLITVRGLGYKFEV